MKKSDVPKAACINSDIKRLEYEAEKITNAKDKAGLIIWVELHRTDGYVSGLNLYDEDVVPILDTLQALYAKKLETLNARLKAL